MMAEDFLINHKDVMDIVIANPTFMLGAYDAKPSSGRIIMMAWRKSSSFTHRVGKILCMWKMWLKASSNALKRAGVERSICLPMRTCLTKISF
jgi:hypothetical protein